MKSKVTVVALLLVFLAGCASHGRHVPRHHSYKTIEFGTVIAAEPVTIGGTRSGIGSYVGSAAAIHDSTSHSFVGLVLRGLAGAFAGAITEEAITRKPGMLYTVEMADGAIIEVLSGNREIANGDCARVSHAGRRDTKITGAGASRCQQASTKLKT